MHAKDCEECDERADGYIDLIRSHITLTGALSEEQRIRLKEIAAKCPVHRTLSGQPQLIEELDIVPSGDR